MHASTRTHNIHTHKKQGERKGGALCKRLTEHMERYLVEMLSLQNHKEIHHTHLGVVTLMQMMASKGRMWKAGTLSQLHLETLCEAAVWGNKCLLPKVKHIANI